jgi:hypothetical protein
VLGTAIANLFKDYFGAWSTLVNTPSQMISDTWITLLFGSSLLLGFAALVMFFVIGKLPGMSKARKPVTIWLARAAGLTFVIGVGVSLITS